MLRISVKIQSSIRIYPILEFGTYTELVNPVTEVKRKKIFSYLAGVNFGELNNK